MRPTITVADTIVKALQDLTGTLQGKINLEGEVEMEALATLQQLVSGNSKSTIAAGESRQKYNHAQPRMDVASNLPKDNGGNPQVEIIARQSTRTNHCG